LYDAACAAGLSGKAQKVFERLGTNNFEGVLRLLDDTKWVGSLYGLAAQGVEDVDKDLEIVKSALVSAVAKSHLDHSGLVSDVKKASALKFLSHFHSIFTTNYDLVLYWTIMAAEGRVPFADGFRSSDDEPEAPYVVFGERLGNTSGLYYLHGALHLYLAGGELRKHTWNRTGQRLTDLIRAGLEAGEYPLFVAEGTPERKLEQIQRHGYLWYSLDKLARIESPLVVYGHALGSSDAHLADTLSQNPKLAKIFIGLHGDLESEKNSALVNMGSQLIAAREKLANMRKNVKELEVFFYQSESAEVWTRK
jgi:hypothetical protein